MKRFSMILVFVLVAIAAYDIEATRRGPATASAASLPATQGRYAVTALGSGQYAVMVDSATGKVWYLAFTQYCSSPTGDLRMTSYSAGCKDTETVLPPQPSFEQVSVNGLYTSPSDPIVEVLRQAKSDVK